MSTKLVLQALSEFRDELHVFLAVSGGLDSMVLMHGMARLGLSATVLHVNHGLRSNESDRDEAFTKQEAQNLGFVFKSVLLDWTTDKPSQNESRKKREVFFKEHCANGSLLFAHHADDQAETIFQRLLRGTGLDGLAGMKKRNGYKVRPFLTLTKEDLKNAALAWGVKWREDSSNSSSKYERNWIRNEIFPLLEKHKPGIKRRLCALGKEAAGLSRKDLNFCEFNFERMRFYRLGDVSSLDLKRLFQLSRSHAEELERIVRSGRGRMSAKNEFWLSCEILLVRGKKTAAFSTLDGPEIFESILGSWKIPSKIEGNISFRGSLALGDRAKKILQESSIPIFFRDSIPFLLLGAELVLLTPEFAKQRGIVCVPSELGAWFFSASLRSGGLVAEISKEEIQPQWPLPH